MAPPRLAAGPVHLVVPEGIDDPRTPSGGNSYDVRVRDGLHAAGHDVREVAVAGAWPVPGAEARAALDRALAGLPDGATVLADGLVACGVPDVVVPHAGRLALAVLVHLPLAEEAGLPPGAAAERDARERAVLRAVPLVVATSPWTAARVAERHGIAAERVRVVTPGVEPAPLAPGTDGASRLLCVGSLTPTKGQDVLVTALAALAAAGTVGPAGFGWTCDLVGPQHRDPGFAHALRSAIARHGLDGRIGMPGPLAGPALDAAYAAADLLVLPSRTEAYGMVVTEALVRGIPVLAADTGGVRDALGTAPDGALPGLLVPPGDAEALAAALRRWLADPGLRAGLRGAARRRRPTLDGWEVTSRCLAAALDAGPRG